MPQVDLETLVSACTGAVSYDSKVASETLGSGADHHPASPPEVSDLDPPESFLLSKDAEVDWFDRNAFYERKDSGNRNSGSLNPNQHPPAGGACSQRFSNMKPKTLFIGLPKTQKAAYVEAKSRRCSKPAGAAKLFQKRAGSTGKPVVPSLVEPSSPKVSCIGRVRSRRDWSRRMRSRQRSKRLTEPEKPKKAGFLESFRAVFRGRRMGKTAGNNPNPDDGDSYQSPPSRTRRTGDISDRLPAGDIYAPPPAGIGGIKRFASGRKSAELLGCHVA